jgi:hypothetical protein
MNARTALGAAATLAATLFSTTAAADDRLLLSGGEYSDAAYYGYTGVILPGPGRKDGQGLMQRYWIDRVGYEYVGGPGIVKAEAWGAEAALGYGTSSAAGWSSFWIGARYSDTSLSPDDRTATARGTQVGAKLQVETERNLSPRWKLGAAASYITTQQSYWLRARSMHRMTRVASLGVEAVAIGNDESESQSFGLVTSFQPAPTGWSVALKAGYRTQKDTGDGAYAGLEFGYSF